MQNKQHFTLTAQLKAEKRDAIPNKSDNPEDNKQPTTATQVDGNQLFQVMQWFLTVLH